MLSIFRPVGPVGINWGASKPATAAPIPNRMPRMSLPIAERAKEVGADFESADAGGRECPSHSAG